MSPLSDGRKSRVVRTKERHSGSWTSSSQDFVRAAYLLYDGSAQCAANSGGNCSWQPLAGIPMLWSALRCLLVELNAGLYLWNFGRENQVRLEALSKSVNDVDFICAQYVLPPSLSDDLRLLLEVRHEILHPASRPGPDANHTPGYLQSLRNRDLLQRTGKEIDFTWIAQLQSHRLFRWAFETIAATVEVLLLEHRVPEDEMPLLQSYHRYLEIDAA